ncbi:MAG TPA: hypothetical protein VF366_03615 [Dehalococcoidia bacterium]
MRIRTVNFTAAPILGMLIIGLLALTACSSPSSAISAPAQSQSETNLSDNKEAAPGYSATTQPPEEVISPTIPASPVSVVVAGYINHGPLQPTVRAIKEVLSKYDDKVTVTWIDLNTAQGQSYFQEHGLTAHMNVIINGKSRYEVDGKTVDFEWFEGQQWTEEELDSVLASLIHS